jgi:peptidoglycan hydrolase-like protein with peptidoglycan-binding domain
VKGIYLSRVAAVLAIVMLTACAKPDGVAPPAPPPVAAPPVVVQAPAAPVPAVLTDASSILLAQRILVLLGYDVGKPDGVAGAATRRAILAFQKDHTLPQDGLITTALLDRLKTLQAGLQRSTTIALAAGDTLIYSDSSVEMVAAERVVQWDQAFGKNVLVAARPATAGWPPAARAGLDWAISHALDQSGNAPTQWSSTGVEQRFEIRTFALSPREVAVAGSQASSCRRFEMRSDARRYPGIACRDRSGSWIIARSKVKLARPATELGRAAVKAPQSN